MKAADHELALEPSRKRLLRLAELRERTLDHVHLVHPAEQIGVGLRDLECDLSALAWILRKPQRLLELRARRLAPGARLRPGGLAANADPRFVRWRL